MAECDPPPGLAALIDELIARKAVTRELGEGPLPEPVVRFVDEEFALARETLPALAPRLDPEARAAAEALFRSTLARVA